MQLLQRAGQRGQDREASQQALELCTLLATDCPLRYAQHQAPYVLT